MSYKKILFSGCSFTDSSDLKNHHWTNLLCQHYKAQCYNTAMGGSSNSEIFFRAVEHNVTDNYDLTVVAWSSLSRLTVYYADHNVDLPTIVNPFRIAGFNQSDSILSDLAKLYYGNFDNCYMHLKHWLLQAISLANFLTNQGRSYVFIKGFENYLSDFLQINYSDHMRFTGLSDQTRSLLDFSNRPDDYIKQKVNIIQSLIYKVKTLNWVNFESNSIFDGRVDFSSDGVHPGIESNKRTYNQIISYLESQM
jgi:hypothetical protein